MHDSLARYGASGLLVIAVLFPGIWFIDLLFEGLGGRLAKMFAWVIVLMWVGRVAGYSCWLKIGPGVNCLRIDRPLVNPVTFCGHLYE